MNSLEIAQQAILMPIDQIAEQVGLQPEEVEPYGRYKAKISLSASSIACPTGPTASSSASPA